MEINCRLRTTRGMLQKDAYVYPEPIDAGRIGGDDFVEALQRNCGVTPAMARAVFSGMTSELLKDLTLGHSVEIPGLGVFRVDVKGKVKERKTGTKYIDNGKINISFTPRTEVHRRLNEATLKVMSGRVVKGACLTEEAAMAVVDRLLETRRWFMCKHFSEETGASLSQSYRLLNALSDKKLLLKQREGGIYIYSRPV